VVAAVEVVVVVSWVLSAGGMVWSCGWVGRGVCAWWCAAVVVAWVVYLGGNVWWR
jgi:hypothetical protein